jgi:hypothetical protein
MVAGAETVCVGYPGQARASPMDQDRVSKGGTPWLRFGHRKWRKINSLRAIVVGERGFEPPAPASRRQCSTRLSYSPTESGTLKCLWVRRGRRAKWRRFSDAVRSPQALSAIPARTSGVSHSDAIGLVL